MLMPLNDFSSDVGQLERLQPLQRLVRRRNLHPEPNLHQPGAEPGRLHRAELRKRDVQQPDLPK